MEKIHKIEGRCHCGNISYSLLTKTGIRKFPVKSCNCSFCLKHGSNYITDPEGELLVRVLDKQRIVKYEFDTETAKFIMCGCCGIMPMVVTKMENKYYAIINSNTLDEVGKLPPQKEEFHYEGEDEAARAERRKKSWINSVHGVSYFFNLKL